jgi:hypothetical protein
MPTPPRRPAIGPRPPKPRSPESVQPSNEQIRNRAYSIYEARTRNGQPGDAVSDWLKAEQELRASPERV